MLNEILRWIRYTLTALTLRYLSATLGRVLQLPDNIHSEKVNVKSKNKIILSRSLVSQKAVMAFGISGTSFPTFWRLLLYMVKQKFSNLNHGERLNKQGDWKNLSSVRKFWGKSRIKALLHLVIYILISFHSVFNYSFSSLHWNFGWHVFQWFRNCPLFT